MKLHQPVTAYFLTRIDEYSNTVSPIPTGNGKIKAHTFFTENKWFIHVNGSYKSHFLYALHSLSPVKQTAVVRMQYTISQQKCHLWWLLALHNAALAARTHTHSILISSVLNRLASWSFMYKHNLYAWRGKSGAACEVVCMRLTRMHPSARLCYQSGSWFISWEPFPQTEYIRE